MTLQERLRGMKLPAGYNKKALDDAADKLDRLQTENEALLSILREYLALDDKHFPSAAPFEWMLWHDKVVATIDAAMKEQQ